MSNKQDQENKTRYLIIMILIFIAIAILEIFICKTAFALEIKNPDSTITISNNTYYGYNIPTRATLTDSLGQSVHINVAHCTNNYNCTTMESDNIKIGVRDIDSYVQDYIRNNNINVNIPKLWSSTYEFRNLSPLLSDPGVYRLVFGFKPGGITNSDQDVIEDGFAINYDSYYSYTFDIILYGENGVYTNNEESLGDWFYSCTYNDLTQSQSCVSGSNRFQITKIIDDFEVQYYRVTVPFNSFSMYGFNQSAISNQSSEFGVEGKNLFSPQYVIKPIVNGKNVKVLFSEPYNITLWNQSSSMTCDSSCWTQSETDENQRIINIENYTWNLINDVVTSFDYHGFSGIVGVTYNFIISVLQDSLDNTCHDLTIPVLSTSFDLPSACYFWNRSDVSTFESFYHLFWLGLTSYFIAWRVFKDIVKMYDPDSHVIDGNEVADL